MLFSIQEFHGQWWRKGNTFLIDINHITFVCVPTFYIEYYPRCCRSTVILQVAEACQHFATTIMSVKASTIRGRFYSRTFQKHHIISAIVFSAKITVGIPLVRTKNSKLTQYNDTMSSNVANIIIQWLYRDILRPEEMNYVYGDKMYKGKMDRGFIANNEDDFVLATCI